MDDAAGGFADTDTAPFQGGSEEPAGRAETATPGRPASALSGGSAARQDPSSEASQTDEPIQSGVARGGLLLVTVAEWPNTSSVSTAVRRTDGAPARRSARGLSFRPAMCARPYLLLLFSLACGDDSSAPGGGGAGNGGAGEGGSGATATSGGGGSGSGAGQSAGGSGVGGSTPGCRVWATFDGVDDVLRVEDSAEAALSDGFSVGAFVRGHGAIAEGQIAFLIGRHLDGSSNGFYLQATREQGQLLGRFVIFSGGGTCYATASLPEPSSPDDAVHVLGSFASPDVRVFVNGQQATLDQPCGAFQSPIEPTSLLTVGRSDGGVFPFAGAIARPIYLGTAITSAFDDATLGCADGASLLYDFAGLEGTTGQAAIDRCDPATPAQIGDDAAVDAAEPVFACGP